MYDRFPANQTLHMRLTVQWVWEIPRSPAEWGKKVEKTASYQPPANLQKGSMINCSIETAPFGDGTQHPDTHNRATCRNNDRLPKVPLIYSAHFLEHWSVGWEFR